jgi:hypothetical protein
LKKLRHLPDQKFERFATIWTGLVSHLYSITEVREAVVPYDVEDDDEYEDEDD